MTHSLVPMGPARIVLENFPASVTKAGRVFCAIMVMLPLIHCNRTFFVDRDLCASGTDDFVIAQYTRFLY